MTTEELTRAFIEMDARMRALERQYEIVRDLLSRCLIIPLPTPLPPLPGGEEPTP